MIIELRSKKHKRHFSEYSCGKLGIIINLIGDRSQIALGWMGGHQDISMYRKLK